MNHDRMSLGVDIWHEIVLRQQEIIAASPTGEILPDNPMMWQECLDLLDNEHWELIFETLDAVREAKFLRPHQERMIQEAKDYYAKHKNRSDRAMDINPRYKKPSWGCVMVMREIWEQI